MPLAKLGATAYDKKTIIIAGGITGEFEPTP